MLTTNFRHLRAATLLRATHYFLNVEVPIFCLFASSTLDAAICMYFMVSSIVAWEIMQGVSKSRGVLYVEGSGDAAWSASAVRSHVLHEEKKRQLCHSILII